MKDKKPRPDTHVSGFMVRLPETYRQALKAAKLQTRRPMVEEIKIALEKHLEGLGVWPVK